MSKRGCAPLFQRGREGCLEPREPHHSERSVPEFDGPDTPSGMCAPPENQAVKTMCAHGAFTLPRLASEWLSINRLFCNHQPGIEIWKTTATASTTENSRRSSRPGCSPRSRRALRPWSEWDWRWLGTARRHTVAQAVFGLSRQGCAHRSSMWINTRPGALRPLEQPPKRRAAKRPESETRPCAEGCPRPVGNASAQRLETTVRGSIRQAHAHRLARPSRRQTRLAEMPRPLNCATPRKLSNTRRETLKSVCQTLCAALSVVVGGGRRSRYSVPANSIERQSVHRLATLRWRQLPITWMRGGRRTSEQNGAVLISSFAA
jgi:hypothetical protein